MVSHKISKSCVAYVNVVYHVFGTLLILDIKKIFIIVSHTIICFTVSMSGPLPIELNYNPMYSPKEVSAYTL